MIKTVFYCDDDNDDLVMFEDVIRTIDPELVYKTSNDSEQALQLLLSGEITPDVIFLDINMPKINGIQMLESLKTGSTMYSDSDTDLHYSSTHRR